MLTFNIKNSGRHLYSGFIPVMGSNLVCSVRLNVMENNINTTFTIIITPDRNFRRIFRFRIPNFDRVFSVKSFFVSSDSFVESFLSISCSKDGLVISGASAALSGPTLIDIAISEAMTIGNNLFFFFIYLFPFHDMIINKI